MSIVLRIGAVRGNTYGADHLASSQEATNSDSDVLDIPPAEDLRHRPAHSYPGCFGLPYQDHNYGAPPPLSPTPPKSPPPPPVKVNGVVELEEETKVPVVSQEEEVVEDSVTRCICGFLHDDGYMICCDKCSVWQHIDCMGVDRNNIPENYCCELCEPRKLDFERARMIQLRKREEIDTSATDTDPEEPANALASLGKKQVLVKPKPAKQRRVSKAREKSLLKSAKLCKSGQYKRDKKLKLTKKEKENMKEANKKQKMIKGSIARQKKMKKKLSSSLVQNKAEQWDNLYGLWNNYEEAKENEYSPEIIELLSRAKSNGIHSPHSIGVFPEELLVRLYQVSEVKKNRKGLEATDLIVPGRAIIEFKGKVMPRDHFDSVVNQAQPYALFYSKFEGLDLCIDASAYGGDARFIRRSCTPNSEMCHIIDNGNLHFIVQAKKEIAKGSEITIPFDFNYQDCATSVECACGKATCPVAKFWKKIKLAQKPAEKPKRKRQASGEGRVRRNSQSKGSPIKAAVGGKSPVKSSPVKSPGVVPAPLSLSDTPLAHEDTTAEGLQSFPVVKPAVPAARRSSRAASDTKEEREVKSSSSSGRLGSTSGKDHVSKPAPVQNHSCSVDSHCSQGSEPPAAHAASESEPDSSSECPKKLTREERKMEAIMKAFEKMAKREERRKEALARLDKKHHDVKDEPLDVDHSMPACTSTSPEICEPVAELPPVAAPAAATVTSPDTQELEGKVVIKIEEPPPTVESPVKAQRRRPRRQRRRSRVQSMSAVEPLHSAPAPLPLPSLSGAPSGVHVAGEENREEAGGDQLPSMPTTPTPGHADLTSMSPDSAVSYMFHKTKKHLYNEWSVSRGPDGRGGGRLDPLEVQVGQEEFVPYTPSPRNAIEHWQRRNSTSAGCAFRATDSAVGNAKKRWLRQAMHETGPPGAESGSSSPVHTGSCSPSHFSSSMHSPGGSPPADFVTPLKKRRLARESLSQDQAPLSTPSTPSPLLIPAATPDFLTSGGSSSATATVTAAMLAAAELQEDGNSASGTSSYQADSKTDSSTRLSDCGESSSSNTEAVPLAEFDPVSQSQQQEELSLDGLSSSVTDRTVQLAYAGSSSSVVLDVQELCDSREGVSDDVQTSSSAKIITNEASAMEMSLVDSSDAVFDSELNLQHGERRGNMSVGSTDSETLQLCVDSADNRLPDRTRAVSDPDRLVDCSSASAHVSRTSQEYSEEGAVSEGLQQMEESMEVEESENEVSGSACPEAESTPTLPPSVPVSAECQVNSSQDVAWTAGTAARTGSPSQREAESNVSSESVLRVLRTRLHQVSERDRERTGVSSAQDISPVSSFTRDAELAASSDTEWGPSSSTQVSARLPVARRLPLGSISGDDLVCNSSDVLAHRHVPPVEEGNVDSTSHSSGSRNVLRHTAALHGSVENSHLEEDSEASSFCDSNSERGEQPAMNQAQGVSSSGPADSQSTEVVESGQVCVVSSIHSGVSPCTPSVSSSPCTSVRVSDSPVSGREACNVMASSSTPAATAENMDAPAPSHPTSSASPCGSGTSLNVVDSASHDNGAPMVNSASSLTSDRLDMDLVGTSQLVLSTSTPGGHVSPEANASWSGLPVSEQGDVSTQPVSSLSLPMLGMGDGEMVNGNISSASSEDSYGVAPSTSVSSSEAQAAQRPATVTKRKVSLLEYRKRLKDKGSAGGPSSSPKSTTSDNGYTSRRSILDSSVTLAPLPLFEPITINSERREPRDKEKEKREKPMSLSDRLRIEFGLEDSEEDERGNSTESLPQSSLDIPPPPPLPPNGIVGGAGIGPRSLSGSSVPRTRPTEDESESRQAAASSLTPGNTATSSTVTATALANAVSLGLNHGSVGQVPQGQSFGWSNKVQGRSQGLLGASPAMAGQQNLAGTPGGASHAQGLSQQSSHAHLMQGPGGPRLPNGSHSQSSSSPVFSSGPAYPSLPQGHQPFRNGGTQQPPPPPPPPPSTAYPPYIAQSRTRPPPPHTPTSSQAASSSVLATRHGRSASSSHRSSLLGAAPALTSSHTRHSAEDRTSPTHLTGHHQFDYSQGSISKQKGHFSNHSNFDRKRH